MQNSLTELPAVVVHTLYPTRQKSSALHRHAQTYAISSHAISDLQNFKEVK
jgi:hypothetical protein